MVKPDYKNSIVNLMSSLTQGLGGKKQTNNPYQPLISLPQDEIENSQHVVMLLIDGLGYNYIQAHSRLLKSSLRSRLTSVFPSTTAAAISSILTGRAPQQHAVTGWFMNVKELGTVAALLPFRARWGGTSSFADAGAKIRDVMTPDSFFNGIAVSSHFIIGKDIVDSPYSITNAGRAQRHGYAYCPDKDFAHCVNAIENVVLNANEKSFTYAYWPYFDSLSHEHGINHKETHQHFRDIETALEKLFDRLQNTNTLFIVISDHGIVDSEPNTTVYLDNHPKLRSYLNLPLCGEPRVAYCYVRSDSIGAFNDYTEQHLSNHFECYPSHQLIEEGWFGLGEQAPTLNERVGDYILVGKDNSVIVDRLLTEGPWGLKGVHGGTHQDEMYVPLITRYC